MNNPNNPNVVYINGQPGMVQQGAQVYSGPPIGNLPTFPALATQVEAIATRIPWYAWLAVGAYLGVKYLKK